MKKLTSFLIILSFVIGFSCKDDSIQKQFSLIGENYLEISIDGKKYNNLNNLVSSGKSSDKTCDDKPGALVFVGQIDTTEFFFDFYLKHYYNLSDFESAELGTFNVKNIIFDSVCNFDAVATLQDLTESSVYTILQPGGTNKITKITAIKISQSDEKLYGIKGDKYEIKGEFNIVFKNQSEEDIEVSGIYVAFIYFLE